MILIGFSYTFAPSEADGGAFLLDIPNKQDMADINPNPASSESQKSKILAHLLKGEGITPMDALELYGSFRLGARIAEIKALGYDVKSEFVKLPNGKQVKRYHL